MGIRKVRPAVMAALCITLSSSALKAELLPAAQKIEGTWVVTVTRLNAPPNLDPTFVSLMTYLPGGGVIESSSTGRTNRGPAFGEWVRTGDRQFTNTLYFLRFDPGERYAGYTKVVRNFQLSQTLDIFQGVSVQELYDTDGKLIDTRRATEAGQRLALGEIPDKP